MLWTHLDHANPQTRILLAFSRIPWTNQDILGLQYDGLSLR